MSYPDKPLENPPGDHGTSDGDAHSPSSVENNGTRHTPMVSLGSFFDADEVISEDETTVPPPSGRHSPK